MFLGPCQDGWMPAPLERAPAVKSAPEPAMEPAGETNEEKTVIVEKYGDGTLTSPPLPADAKAKLDEAWHQAEEYDRSLIKLETPKDR